MKKPKLIYYNDSRHYHLYRRDPLMSLHSLRAPVDDILGTPVDTLSYGLATGLAFLHDTKVGFRFGEKVTEHMGGLVWWRAAENLVQSLKSGHDPLKVVVDRAHEKGIQVLCSMRMNTSMSASDRRLYNMGRLWWENPQVQIGAEGSENPDVDTAYDYARPEVREERLAVIEEVCDRYGADGFEFDDSMRVFFKPSDVRRNTPILTDFMREARAILDRIGRKRGEALCLAARVHPVEEANLEVGMDVKAWLSEGLVDLVIPFRGGLDSFVFDQNPSFGWLAEAAQQAGAWVYAPLERAPYDDRNHLPTLEMYRAAAANCRAAGADGLYLSDLPWPHTEQEYAILREMADPDISERKSKHYYPAPQVPNGNAYQPKRHVPQVLEQGATARVPIFVADALGPAREDGELERVTLGVRVVQTCPKDRLTFRFNGKELPQDQARVSTYYGGIVSYTAHRVGLPLRILTHYWLHFDLPLDLPREGDNEVEVTMESLFEPFVRDRVLESVELLVDYKEPPVPVQGQM